MVVLGNFGAIGQTTRVPEHSLLSTQSSRIAPGYYLPLASSRPRVAASLTFFSGLANSD